MERFCLEVWFVGAERPGNCYRNFRNGWLWRYREVVDFGGELVLVMWFWESRKGWIWVLGTYFISLSGMVW